MVKKVLIVACAVATLAMAPMLGQAARADGTGYWTDSAPSITPRDNASVAVLDDGRVVVAGGVSESAATAAAEIYDPATKAWTALPDAHTPRWLPRATALPGGKVLVVGGGDFQAAGSGTYEVYSTTTNSWSPSRPKATMSWNAELLTLANGTALYLDEQDSAIYDPGADTWQPLAVPWAPHRSVEYAVTLASGNVLAVLRGYEAETYIFDPSTRTWRASTVAPSMPSHYTQGTTMGDGRVFAIASVFDYSSNSHHSYAQIFDPATETWAATTLPTDDLHGATLATTPEGNALLVGRERYEPISDDGCSCSGYISAMPDTWMLDQATNAWSRQADLQEPRSYPRAVTTRFGVLTVGGSNPRTAKTSEVFATPHPRPDISIRDANGREGGAGLTRMNFKVTLAEKWSQDVTLRLDLVSGTAAASSDFVAGPVFFTVPAGRTSIMVPVKIRGDNELEADETFSAKLSGDANFADPDAVGTIVNDDIGACTPGALGSPVCVGVQSPV